MLGKIGQDLPEFSDFHCLTEISGADKLRSLVKRPHEINSVNDDIIMSFDSSNDSFYGCIDDASVEITVQR